MSIIYRQRGRPPLKIDTTEYTVMLERGDAEWAKQQPGGLSAMLRDLLAWERWLIANPDGEADLAAAKRLAVKGEREPLTDAEQAMLRSLVLRITAEKCDG